MSTLLVIYWFFWFRKVNFIGIEGKGKSTLLVLQILENQLYSHLSTGMSALLVLQEIENQSYWLSGERKVNYRYIVFFHGAR